MNFLKQLRDAAKACTNKDYACALATAACAVEQDIEYLSVNATQENLTILNGSWVSAVRLLNNIPAEGTPSPLSGSPEPARLAS